ncbi:hypothetical protein [Nocardioides koreensis]
MTATVVETATARRPDPWSASARGWRLALLLGWALMVVIAVVVGERQSSLRDLQHAVAAGEVHEVRIAGGMSAQARGFSTVEVHWRRGLLGYTTTVIEARPLGRAPRGSERGEATAVIGEDLGTRLQAVRPGLEVVTVDRTHRSTDLLGWRLPDWTSWLLLALWVSTLLVLVGSPEPWRATRWAWFWLMCVATPLGMAAYLLLAGPTPLVPAPRNPARRLTGGWAFLLAAAISSVADSIR